MIYLAEYFIFAHIGIRFYTPENGEKHWKINQENLQHYIVSVILYNISKQIIKTTLFLHMNTVYGINSIFKIDKIENVSSHGVPLICDFGAQRIKTQLGIHFSKLRTLKLGNKTFKTLLPQNAYRNFILWNFDLTICQLVKCN